MQRAQKSVLAARQKFVEKEDSNHLLTDCGKDQTETRRCITLLHGHNDPDTMSQR